GAIEEQIEIEAARPVALCIATVAPRATLDLVQPLQQRVGSERGLQTHHCVEKRWLRLQIHRCRLVDRAGGGHMPEHLQTTHCLHEVTVSITEVGPQTYPSERFHDSVLSGHDAAVTW